MGTEVDILFLTILFLHLQSPTAYSQGIGFQAKRRIGFFRDTKIIVKMFSEEKKDNPQM